jgi:hypothetical protein
LWIETTSFQSSELVDTWDDSSFLNDLSNPFSNGLCQPHKWLPWRLGCGRSSPNSSIIQKARPSQISVSVYYSLAIAFELRFFVWTL